MIVIGVDPGKSGAMTVLFSDGKIESSIVPLIGKRIDLNGLNEFFQKFKEQDVHIFIEDVHAIFGSAAYSTFGFGYVCGLLEMCIVANNLPYTKVQPKVWQKVMWLGVPLQLKPSKDGVRKGSTDTKLMSLLACKRLFPNANLTKSERAKKDNDGIVDSLLIAEYGRRYLRQ